MAYRVLFVLGLLLLPSCAILGQTGDVDEVDGADDGADVDRPDTGGHTGDVGQGEPSDVSADSNAAVCDGIDCGPGSCEAGNEGPVCVCDPGFEAWDGRCVDPCEEADCYYFDIESGDDANPGTAEAPLASQAGLDAIAGDLGPGDRILFRAGQTWPQLTLSNLGGSPTKPITITSWVGDSERATVALLLRKSSFVEVKDLDFEITEAWCLEVEGASDHIYISSSNFRDCNRAVVFEGDVSFSAIYDNRIDGGIHGIYLTALTDELGEITEDLGDHHWIAGNVISGVRQKGITTFGNAVTDVKIAGNVIVDASFGISTDNFSGALWITQNTIANAGVGIRLGDWQGTRLVSGNVVFGGDLAVNVLLHRTHLLFNTLVVTNRAAVHFQSNVNDARLLRNILSGGEGRVVYVEETEVAQAIAELDYNWYSPPGACRFRLGPYDDQSHLPVPTEDEPGSRCGEVPVVTPGDPVTLLDDPSAIDQVTPDSDWEGCDVDGAPIGAFDCDGNRMGGIDPLDGYPENGGRGWFGPDPLPARYE